ncbi:ATP-dependent DNA helicase DDX11-like [Apostichopus japonicus]|uniref:ATP-dependent DNA helicase DDX11-like n=1 Tax=Stichopus japonicus TaxID=307972 RepID=UPI003AB28F43
MNCTTADARQTTVGEVEFPFPFPPYPIQEDFMQNLYSTLQDGKVGIFESPTGTGKSLSLICGALTWLRDFEEQQRKELDSLIQENSDINSSSADVNQKTQSEVKSQPEWLFEFDSKKSKIEEEERLKAKRELLKRRETKLRELKSKAKSKKRKLVSRENFSKPSPDSREDAEVEINPPGDGKVEDDDEILVADYTSDQETEDGGSDEEEGKVNTDELTKVYYCSRTHSQLSQFVHEVRKSPFGGEVRLTNLGSRQTLCINPTVRKLKSLTLINDRCLDMQRNKTVPKKSEEDSGTAKRRRATSTSCPYYNQARLEEFKDKLAMEPLDIEQLVDSGKEIKACPYYGTRHAVPFSQIVVLPYNILLHKSTREACGIKLDGNIVIIDEAHNLLETISSVHSVEVSGRQVNKAFSQLGQYMHRYKSRLKAKNLMYIKQILQVLTAFIGALGSKPASTPATNQEAKPGSSTTLLTINDFLFEAKLDNINFFKLQRYCQRSKISHKLNGFVEKKMDSEVKLVGDIKESSQAMGMSNFLKQIKEQQLQKGLKNEKNIKDEAGGSSCESMEASSPLMHIQSFLQALTNADRDGRVVIYKKELLSQASMKFLLLNPAVHFDEVVTKARSVVIAGGTMQPLDEFKHQLFSCTSTSPDRILEFSCGHVIPPDHLLPICLSHGPSGRQMEFTFQSRNKPETLDELGRILVNLSTIIPAGLVCFFPSYEYADNVFSYWGKTGVLSRLEKKKAIFQEPKKATQVEQVLGSFASVIKKTNSASKPLGTQNGAILFCVVGGKMSEGINFSDDMGRCVIMVGLPYANIQSPELKEKMDYLNATMPLIQGRTAGQVHYENMCMKAVNQSIGRAIRHKDDYATIVLVDHRYGRPSVQTKLPGWIYKQLHTTEKFGKAFALIRQFFVSKRP